MTMAATFKFELVSPERVLLSVDAEQAVVPSADGEFTMLPGHAPVIAMLRPGVIDVSTQGGRKRLFVKSGFADVDPTRLTILAEKAFDVGEMTPAIIAEELRSAEAMAQAAADDDAKFHADTLVSELKRLSNRAA
jgi:F-type H+-transporting ATPase subunit epsilon